MGGGRANFLPATTADPEDEGKKGKRKDGKDLTQAWLDRYSNSGAYVWNKEQFDALDPANVDHVLGLFEMSHMEYEHDRPKDKAGEPSLAEMAEKAIDILAKNPEGYVLMIEGGRIDHGSHASNAYRTLSDAVALNEAVKAVLRKVNLDETLIVVTGDHSHTLTIAGYAKRGNPILGISIGVDGKPVMGADGKPYTTIGFANGPGGCKEPQGAPDDHHGGGDRPRLHPAVAGPAAERDPWRRGSRDLRDRPLVASVPGHGRGELHLPRDGLRLEDQRTRGGRQQRRAPPKSPRLTERARSARRAAGCLPGAAARMRGSSHDDRMMGVGFSERRRAWSNPSRSGSGPAWRLACRPLACLPQARRRSHGPSSEMRSNPWPMTFAAGRSIPPPCPCAVAQAIRSLSA